jgi:hypothetical protein
MHVRKLLAAVETRAVLPLPWIDIDDGGGPRAIARTMRTEWMIPPGPVANLTDLPCSFVLASLAARPRRGSSAMLLRWSSTVSRRSLKP